MCPPRPELFAKAFASIADRIVLDLEDGVPLGLKDDARRDAIVCLRAQRGDPRIVVRINALTSEWAPADLEALAELGGPVTVRIPKTQHPDDVERVVGVLGDDATVECLIESAVGLENASLIARAPGVAALGLGETDLLGDLGANSDHVVGWIRARVVVASRAAGLRAPMMSVFPDHRDMDGLRRSTIDGRAAGFIGRNAIHPAQLLPIVEACRPSEADVTRARSVLRTLDDGGGASAGEHGMVDGAMASAARRILNLEALAVRALERAGREHLRR